MEELRQRLPDILKVKNIVKTKNSEYICHNIIKNINFDKGISIVMTSHNRSRQVYYTLKTISQSSFKNIQIILVDDSTTDPVNLNELKKYPFYIDFITIKNKFWKNPCINYNIGFQYIQGNKIIIQNSEVCHINDVIAVSDRIQDNQYFVFDVASSPNFKVNESIYQIDNLNCFPAGLGRWYQHHSLHNVCYHFLVGMTINTFKLINEFSYDYAFHSWYDDDDFLFKVKIRGIKIINIKNEEVGVCGIHLFHDVSPNTNDKVPRAQFLLNRKKHYHSKKGIYFELSDSTTKEQIVEKLNALFS